MSNISQTKKIVQNSDRSFVIEQEINDAEHISCILYTLWLQNIST